MPDLKKSKLKSLEHVIESTILASRWLLVVFYLGLTAALGLYAISFAKKLWEFFSKVMVLEETDAILKILSLIDASLVASLVVMVIISGYENFVSRLDNVSDSDAELSWLGKIDASSLKIKVASTIVAISSIHLLQVFLNSDQYADDKIMWLTIVHMTFVVSALLLALIDRIMSGGKAGKHAD
ncbi:MAG: TIGR00645 family protein [Aestuariivirga sp.]